MVRQIFTYLFICLDSYVYSYFLSVPEQTSTVWNKFLKQNINLNGTRLSSTEASVCQYAGQKIGVHLLKY